MHFWRSLLIFFSIRGQKSPESLLLFFNFYYLYILFSLYIFFVKMFNVAETDFECPNVCLTHSTNLFVHLSILCIYMWWQNYQFMYIQAAHTHVVYARIEADPSIPTYRKHTECEFGSFFSPSLSRTSSINTEQFQYLFLLSSNI